MRRERIAKTREGNSTRRFSEADYLPVMESTPAPRAYRIAVHRARGCYFVRVIDLPGCTSRGATEVEAVENARAAIRAYLWVAQALSGDRATLEFEIRA